MILTSKRILFFIPLISLILLTLTALSQGMTLGEELDSHDIEVSPHIVPNQNRNITSYATYDGTDALYIGFYIDSGTNNLSDDLHLGMFDKRKQQWKETIINTRSLPGQARDASPCAMMAGSVTGIDRAFGNIFIRTHGNPSAGCTLVLTEDLVFRDALYGFFLGAIDEKTVVYQHSEVHFAPTHYVEVSAYDLIQKKSAILYPPKLDASIRKEHVEKVRAAYLKMEKTGECRRMNHHCDPELFNCSLSSSAVNPDTDSVILQIAFDNKDWMRPDSRLRTEVFHDFMRETGGRLPDNPVPEVYYTWLSADLYRAKNMETMGWENRVSKVLALFEGDPELQGLMQTAIENIRNAGRMTAREWFLNLNPKWDSPELWKRLIKAIAAPQERTQVAYVYRNIKRGKPAFAEMLLADLFDKYGKKSLSEYLDKETITRLIK